MTAPAVRQFAGDIRFWEKGAAGALVAVIPEAADPDGNQPIETNAFTFAYEAGDEINVVSKRRDARYNQPVYTDTLPGTTSVSATLLELPPLILARILFGEGSTAVLTAGSVTDEAVSAGASLLSPIQLAHRLVSSVVVKKGVATLVAGTDYTVDLRRGQVLPKSGGDIDAADALLVSYSYAAQVSTSIQGGAVPTKSYYITGDMQDRISGENGELRIPEARLTVDGDVDWLSSEPIQAVLTGACVVASGETAPYTFVAYKAAV
jgi:hypothetical protein